MKVSGEIGYAKSIETTPGVYDDQITRKPFSGDLIQDTRKWESDQKVNDNLVLGNRVSILASSFARANLDFMKFVKIGESYWEISNIQIQYPRLFLTLGSVYNGNKS